jgi:BirA family transcriptional regulator, biotin operon repressor / biotin---[acetyl-CoA-carboxylase] ligase
MDVNSLRENLADLPIPDIQHFKNTGSTNDIAIAWCESDAGDGSLVIADTQTSGRGRLGRRWITAEGAALAFSLLLRPTPSETKHLGLFSALAGLAVSQALKNDYNLDSEIKWPNDVLVNRRKVCGILTEAVWQGSHLSGLVVGIGINIAPSSVPPDKELLFPATSVEQELGKTVEMTQILHSVINSFFAWRQHLAEPVFFQTWEKHLAFLGEVVQVKTGFATGREDITGEVVGISSEGNLRLRSATGEELQVTVGDVHLRSAHQ